MTRKDYELIAQVFKAMPDTFLKYDEGTVKDLAEEMAVALATTNPRFNRDIFLEACGVGA